LKLGGRLPEASRRLLAAIRPSCTRLGSARTSGRTASRHTSAAAVAMADRWEVSAMLLRASRRSPGPTASRWPQPPGGLQESDGGHSAKLRTLRIRRTFGGAAIRRRVSAPAAAAAACWPKRSWRRWMRTRCDTAAKPSPHARPSSWRSPYSWTESRWFSIGCWPK
jgi:hypothetical protein